MSSSIFKDNMDIAEAEAKLLEECNLVKKNDRVYYSKSKPSIISKKNILLFRIGRKHVFYFDLP